MSPSFLKVLNISITAGWLVLAVVVLRFVLKKAPKWVHCLLWGLVALRLVLPFTIESRLSLLPSAEPVRTESAAVERSADLRSTSVPYERVVLHSGFDLFDDAVNPVLAKNAEDAAKTGTDESAPAGMWVTRVWIAGVGAMLLYAAVSFLVMKHKVRVSITTERNVYVCDDVQSPFILGAIRPRIYLPSGLDEGSRPHVLAHERAHIQRLDHLWKPLGFLLLSIHWFNPMIWMAFILFSRDIEFACDEKVIAQLDVEGKAAYSHTLLAFSRPRGAMAVCPVAFGEVGVKERIRSILRYKKPALWAAPIALFVGAVFAVCFLTAPKTAKTVQARMDAPAPVSKLPLPKKLSAHSADREEEPEPDREKTPVSLDLLMCVSQQCDVAE